MFWGLGQTQLGAVEALGVVMVMWGVALVVVVARQERKARARVKEPGGEGYGTF